MVLKRARSLSPGVVDWLIAGVLTAYAEADVWLRDVVPGPKLVGAVGLALMTLPLGLRRRWPLAVACVSMGALALETLVAGAAPQGGVILFPILLVLYTVAAHAELWRALLGAGVALAATIVQSVQDPNLASAGDIVLVDGFFFGLIGGSVWALGRYVRHRRSEAARLEGRATLAERDREERARAAVAEERARIARELHDVIAHTVSVMGVQAGAAQQVLRSDPARAEAPLESIQETARDAVAELTRLLGVLRAGSESPARVPQPGLDGLEPLAEQAREAGLTVDLRIGGQRRSLPPGIELSAYRVVQEALTNARKHAAGAHVKVAVDYERDALSLLVEDDGCGPSGNGTGHGILGMRERVALYGGELETGPGPEGGFAVRARLPTTVSES